ncbi:unnamed protein product [Microthlaspi erraticum]|uniref:Uncharacterized protein n=1 Tax=Microthlaspi erraticum TaxID=1685480 RepID=A0A6D2KE12_9BRAS|nr:unnamed protein product [Microthlaspi erraticum]
MGEFLEIHLGWDPFATSRKPPWTLASRKPPSTCPPSSTFGNKMVFRITLSYNATPKVQYDGCRSFFSVSDPEEREIVVI